MRSRTAILAMLALGACSEFDIQGKKEGSGTVQPPAILVEPEGLLFGELRSDEEEVQRFTITSVGETTLTVTDIQIVAGDAFSLVSSDVQMLLDPEQSATIEVAFAPQQVENTGAVRVFSDDPDRPEVDVELLGYGAVPELQITPADYTFEDVFIPCDESVDVTMSNVGKEDLVITDVSFAASSGLMQFDARGTQLPITLGPEESVQVGVTYSALSETPETGTITVASNDPRGELDAVQHGTGEYLGEVTETFTEPGIPPVDIMFLIDQSCSMAADNRDDIQRGIPDFIDELQQVSDWQMILVHGDDGCAEGGILHDGIPNAEQLLIDNAFSGGFGALRYTEALLQLADIALSKTGPAGCNAGFLRPGALLHIIVASDEREQSGRPASHWVQNYSNYVATRDLVKVSSIVDLLTRCGEEAGTDGPGGYLEASQLTGGSTLDICTPDWGSELTDIASEVLAGIRTYNLANQTQASTIVVTVNGNPTTDFVYSPVNSSVTINSPPIGDGDLVEITYKIAGECI